MKCLPTKVQTPVAYLLLSLCPLPKKIILTLSNSALQCTLLTTHMFCNDQRRLNKIQTLYSNRHFLIFGYDYAVRYAIYV
jgi:hypothetical protein